MVSPSSAERRTVRVDPERLSGWLDRFADRHGAITVSAAPAALTCVAVDGAEAHLRLRWGPLPPAADLLAAAVEYALRERTVGVLLVRRKAHAVGVFQGSRRLDGRHDHHYVQGRTKAGGWSQQRYARRRANQTGRAFDEAAEDATHLLLPHLRELDALVTGGDGAGVRAVLAYPGLAGLQALAAATDHPVYSVADPNRTVLDSFPAQYRAVWIELNDLA